MRFKFLVGFAHDKDTLKGGNPDADFAVVLVRADSHTEGRLIAERMVAALGFEPTSVEVIQ